MTRTMTWTDANGAATVLDGSAGITLRDKPIGLEAPNPANTVDNYMTFDGGTLVARRRPPRHCVLDLFFKHATRVETVLAEAASKLQGPGELEWADDVNTRTLREVIYEAGLDGSGFTSLLEAERVVSLLALDPWWYGPAVSVPLSTSAETAFSAAIAFDAVLPFDGGNSTAVTVAGDGEAFPVITVTGPATTLSVTYGGLTWAIAAALGASDVLVVDSRPGSRGPSLNGGAVNWSLLTAPSRLWAVAAGAVSIMSGTTGATGATAITMVYEPRWLTP